MMLNIRWTFSCLVALTDYSHYKNSFKTKDAAIAAAAAPEAKLLQVLLFLLLLGMLEIKKSIN